MDLRELIKLSEEDIQKYLYSHIEKLRKTWWAIRKEPIDIQGKSLLQSVDVSNGFRTKEGKIKKKLPYASFLSLQPQESFIIFVRGRCKFISVYLNFYLEVISVDKDDNR